MYYLGTVMVNILFILCLGTQTVLTFFLTNYVILFYFIRAVF